MGVEFGLHSIKESRPFMPWMGLFVMVGEGDLMCDVKKSLRLIYRMLACSHHSHCAECRS